MAFQTKVDAVNYIVGLYGGTGVYQITLDGLNAIVVLQGSAGGFDQDLEAANEWIRILGGVGNFNQDLAAYNEISRLLGGRSNFNQSIDALNEISLFAGSALIVLSNSAQAENTSTGTTIGTLSVTNGSGSYSFTKTSDPDSAFTLTGAALKNAISFDYETATFHLVTIQANNGVDTPISRVFTILVTDVLEGGGVALKADFSDANANEAWVFW